MTENPQTSVGTNATEDQGGKERPVHEERVGRIKAAIWKNETVNGPIFNVTLSRLWKPEDPGPWKQSSNFGRDDLPLVQEVANRAWLWIYEHGRERIEQKS